MITNIWLKSQPNKKISYPNCYPIIQNNKVIYINNLNINEAVYIFERVTRVEFRP